MSASLVGSEMCIRDRASAVLRLWSDAQAGLKSDRLPLIAELRITLDAVSYTHLTLPTICSV
eukprot:6012341-Alexandrium_andersonii.AAC.1